MSDLLRKYLERDLSRNRDDDDEYDRLKKAEKDARLLEDVGSITSSLQGLAQLEGYSPKSTVPQHFARKSQQASQDLAKGEQRRAGKRRDILQRLDALRGLDREEKADRERQEEKDYRRERDKKQDELREMQFGAKAQEMKSKQAQKIQADESKQKKELEKFYRDTAVAPAIKSADKLSTAADTLEGQLSTIRKDLAAGNYEKAKKQALGTLKAVNSLVTGSPDAVALGEVDILAPELTRSFKNLVTDGKLSDVVGYVNRIQDKVDAVKGTSNNLRSKAEKVLGGESYFDVYGKPTAPKKQSEPKAGDRFVDPDTGETMVWVEED